MILGLYYLTLEKVDVAGEHKLFANVDEVTIANEQGGLDINAKIRTVINGKIVTTTAGRVILHDIIPNYVPQSYWNKVMKKKDISALVDYIYAQSGISDTSKFLDNLKDMGFKYATKAGVSISIDDIKVPDKKERMIADAKKQVIEVQKQYGKGLLTEQERYNKDYRYLDGYQSCPLRRN